MKDFSKSIKSIIEDRISSPFYGTLIVSWLLWNWKITYVTFFIKTEEIDNNKIEYIIKYCSDIHHLITFPIISTILILTLMPFITNGAYWITFLFDSWRVKKKNEISNNQLLTLEQSVELRIEINSLEEKFEKLLSNKDLEIQNLKKQQDIFLRNKDIEIENLKKKIKPSNKNDDKEVVNLRKSSQKSLSPAINLLFQAELNDILNDLEKLKYFDQIANSDIRSNNLNFGRIPNYILSSYVDLGLLAFNKDTNHYAPTEKCKYIYAQYSNTLKEKISLIE